MKRELGFVSFLGLLVLGAFAASGWSIYTHYMDTPALVTQIIDLETKAKGSQKGEALVKQCLGVRMLTKRDISRCEDSVDSALAEEHLAARNAPKPQEKNRWIPFS